MVEQAPLSLDRWCVCRSLRSLPDEYFDHAQRQGGVVAPGRRRYHQRTHRLALAILSQVAVQGQAEGGELGVSVQPPPQGRRIELDEGVPQRRIGSDLSCQLLESAVGVSGAGSGAGNEQPEELRQAKHRKCY